MSHFGLGLISSNGVPGNDAFTKILLHFDGANGSSALTDTNAAGLSNTWTVGGGSPQITTSNAKFGPSSFNIGTVGAGASTPARSDFNVGSGDFTVDFWWNNNASVDGHWASMAGYGNSSVNPSQWSWLIERKNTSGVLSVSISDGTNVGFQDGTTNLNTGNVWHHVAMVRAGGVVKAYVDGSQQISFNWPQAVPGSTGPLKIGAGVSNTGVASSLIDEFRYSVGVARWLTNFTPPTAQYI